MPSIKLVKLRNDISNPEVAQPSDREHTYTIRNFINFSYDISTPISPAPLPEEGSEDNILVKLEGNTGKIKFSWWIKDEDESTVENDNVRTMFEQMTFLREQFAPKSINDSYSFVYISGNDTQIMTDNNIK